MFSKEDWALTLESCVFLFSRNVSGINAMNPEAFFSVNTLLCLHKLQVPFVKSIALIVTLIRKIQQKSYTSFPPDWPKITWANIANKIN